MKNLTQTYAAQLLKCVARFALLLVFVTLPATARAQWPNPVFQSVYSQTPVTQQCSNRSFEAGFTDWTGFRAKHSVPTTGLATPVENFTIAATGPLLSATCVSGPGTGNGGFGNTCHIIESSGTDINMPSVSHPKVVDGGSSLRLGGTSFVTNKSNGYGIDAVAKRFIVQSSDAIYHFRYSTVMEKAHDGKTPTGHEPYFQAIAIDPSTGSVIASIYQPASGVNPLDVVSPDKPDGAPANYSGEPIVYTLWTCAQLDLSSYVGKEVIVYFVNADCGESGHTAYTYIDDTCAKCDKPSDTGITIDPKPTELKICEANKKVQITGTIDIPKELKTSNVTVKLEVVQGGSVLTTLTNGVITGSTYSFDLALANLKGIGCYDLVAVLEYDVTTPAGNVVHVVKKTNPEGFKPGKDNDVCVVDCIPPPVEVPSCLPADAKIKCGAVPGTYVVTITPNGVGGVAPDYVEVSSLTPGVVVTPANASIPVLGGKATVTLSGTAGTVAELQVNGTKINLGSADGTDICCNGKIKVTLPDCPKPIPVDLKIVKTGGTTPAPEVPAYAFSLNITNEGAAYTAAPGVLTVTDIVPAGMIFNAVTGSPGWTCLPNTNVGAGTLITCTYAGGALPAGPAAPVGTISIVATALGQMPFPDFTNCADVALSGADGAVDTKPENNHSCVTVSKKPKDKVDVAIVKTGEVIDQAVVSYAFKLDITNIGSGFAGAGNVVVSDVVPSGMTFNTINGAPDWSCVPSVNAPSGSTVSCNYTGAGPVAPGASMGSIKITAKGVGQSQGTFTNCADVALTPASNLSDANPADNHSCATVSHGPKTNDIKLTKSGGGMGGTQGPNYAFNLDVVNIGAPFNGAGAVQVTDIVPAGMTFLATTGPGWSCNAPVSAGGTLLCTYNGTGIVPTGGALQQIGITAIGPANTPFQNCADATFTASSNLFDGNSVNNHSCVQVNAQKPAINVPAVIGGGIIGGVIVDQVLHGGQKCDPATTLKQGKECVCRFSTMVKNSATTCACPEGTTRIPVKGCVAVPPVCQPPLHLDASGRCVKSETLCVPPMVSGVVPGQCFCPTGMIKEGDTCIRKRNVCQPPMIPAPNDAGCVCPRGTRLERGDCVKDTPVCRAPMVQGARPGQCVCPQGTRQAGGTCIAPPRCRPPMQPNAQGDGCACPAGTVLRGGTCVKPNTCVAPARDNGRGQCVCPQNMQMQNGRCAPVKPRVVPDGVLQHLPGLLLNLPFGGRGGGHGGTGGPRGPVP